MSEARFAGALDGLLRFVGDRIRGLEVVKIAGLTVADRQEDFFTGFERLLKKHTGLLVEVTLARAGTAQGIGQDVHGKDVFRVQGVRPVVRVFHNVLFSGSARGGHGMSALFVAEHVWLALADLDLREVCGQVLVSQEPGLVPLVDRTLNEMGVFAWELTFETRMQLQPGLNPNL